MKKLFGIVCANITPMDTNGELDLVSLEKLVNHMAETGIHGVYPTGTNCEGHLLSQEEQHAVAKKVIDTNAGRMSSFIQCATMKWNDTMFYEDENIKITAFPTAHLKKLGRPSYGYCVEAEGKKVVFTGDLSQWLEEDDYPKAATSQETDMVICEFAHFTPEQIEVYMAKTKTKQFWFNHVGLSKKFDRFEAIREMEKKFSYPVHIACDGDEIEI